MAVSIVLGVVVAGYGLAGSYLSVSMTPCTTPRSAAPPPYFSWYSLGVVAAHSANPTRPTLSAQFIPDTDYLNPDFFCTEPCPQVWGVALEHNLVLASDMNSGLYVLRLR